MAAHTRSRWRSGAWAALAARRSFVESDRGRILGGKGSSRWLGFPAGRTPEARIRCERGKSGRGAGLPVISQGKGLVRRAGRRANRGRIIGWLRHGSRQVAAATGAHLTNCLNHNPKCRHHLAGERSRCWLTAERPASRAAPGPLHGFPGGTGSEVTPRGEADDLASPAVLAPPPAAKPSGHMLRIQSLPRPPSGPPPELPLGPWLEETSTSNPVGIMCWR